MKQIGFQQTFNVGEVSPDFWDRSDLNQHGAAAAMALNMIGRIAGPIGRRPGFWHRGAPKHNDRVARLIPFRKSQGDALLLEFGHEYMRVWTVNGSPVLSSGSPYELATGWTEAQVAGLTFRQVGDVIFFNHRDGLRSRTLKRLGDADWSLADTVFTDGPWLAENVDTGHTLTTSGPTLTSSKPLFDSSMVGRLIRMRETSGAAPYKTWEPEEVLSGVGNRRVSNGRVYLAVGSDPGTTGNTPPIHDRGTASDGGVSWTYQHDGAAIVRISAYTSATQVTIEGVVSGPSMAGGTSFWALGAYWGPNGWPTAWPCVREERLALAGAASAPDAIDFTRTAGFTPDALDFKPGLGTGRVVDDDAVRRFVGDERDRIVWLESATHMIAGTTSGEYLICGATIDDPIVPAGNRALPLTEFGSADVRPVKAYDGLLHVAAGARTLRELRVASDGALGFRDRSEVAGHIAGRGLAGLAWMKQPDNLLWCRLEDGGQAFMTYQPEQNVLGWTRQAIAGRDVPTVEAPLAGGLIAESECVVPGVNGRPRLFILARRTKGGAAQRMLLQMSEPEDGLFLDMAEAYAGSAVNAVSGLDHLTGEAVTLMAATESGAATAPGRGWGEYRDRTVSGEGGAALPEGVTATRIYAGLPYRSRWEGLPVDMEGPGSTAGKKVRYTTALICMDAAVAYVGTTGAEGDSVKDRVLIRDPGDVGGPVKRRRVTKVNLAGGAERDKRAFVETDHGWDMVIHYVRPEAEANG